MSDITPQPIPAVPSAGTNFQPSPGYPFPVYVYGTSVLHQQTQPIPSTWTAQQAADLAAVLASSLTDAGGAIAAPQVGISWAMFIVRTDFFANPDPSQFNSFPISDPNNTPILPLQSSYTYQTILNPVVTPTADTVAWKAMEGCLSYPYFPGNSNFDVNRPSTYQFSFTMLQYDATKTPRFVRYDGTDFPPLEIVIAGISQPTVTAKSSLTLVSQSLGWVLPHETDHTNGILFTDFDVHLPPTMLTPDQKIYLEERTQGQDDFDFSYPLVFINGFVPAQKS